uniref:Sorting nexin-3 n=2 Tax=Ciona intestinalis TaxID=7719 RepID=H2XM49_CIOIN
MINIMDKHHDNISPDEQKEYIHVQVSNPTIHNTHDEGRFTTYQVTLKTNSLSFGLKYSVVDRRYSDFTWLRRALARTCDVKPPSLPFPGIIGTFRKRYLEERQQILTDFLQK